MAYQNSTNVLAIILLATGFNINLYSQEAIFAKHSIGPYANMISGMGVGWNSILGKGKIKGRAEAGMGWTPFNFNQNSIGIPVSLGVQSGSKLTYGAAFGLTSVVTPWNAIESKQVRDAFYAQDTILESGTVFSYYYFPFAALHAAYNFSNSEMLVRFGATAEGTWGIRELDWFPHMTLKYSIYLNPRS